MSNLNKKCICDKICLNLETRADIGHFTNCPQKDEKTWWQKNQIIEEGLKEFDEKVNELKNAPIQHKSDEIEGVSKMVEFGYKVEDSGSIYKIVDFENIKSFLRTFAEKIYKEAREEVIGEIVEKIDENYKGRDITIYELGDWLKSLKE